MEDFESQIDQIEDIEEQQLDSDVFEDLDEEFDELDMDLEQTDKQS